MKKPKKFKPGKIEIWVNFTFETFKYIYDEYGNGEHTTFGRGYSSAWFKNTVPRSELLKEKSDIFIGYL